MNYDSMKLFQIVSIKLFSITFDSVQTDKYISGYYIFIGIIECYNISGEFDFMLKVVEENMDSYYDFHVNRLSQIENMGNVQSVFVMGIIKETHQLVW